MAIQSRPPRASSSTSRLEPSRAWTFRSRLLRPTKLWSFARASHHAPHEPEEVDPCRYRGRAAGRFGAVTCAVVRTALRPSDDCRHAKMIGGEYGLESRSRQRLDGADKPWCVCRCGYHYRFWYSIGDRAADRHQNAWQVV